MSRLNHPEGCEPCGGCAWCRARWQYRNERNAARREARALRRLLAKSIVYMHTAAEYDEGEAQPDPHAAKARRFIAAVRRRLARDGRPR